MNIVIGGAGEVGGHAAEVLSGDGHKVTVIDLSAERLSALGDTLDVRTLQGHCAHYDVLHEAGVDRCDVLLAATDTDEINLLSAFMAKVAGAKKTIVRVHHTANFSLRGTPQAVELGIDEFICPEYLTSLAIARTIRNPGAIVIEEFGGGHVIMQRFPVTHGAAAAGKQLMDLTLPSSARVVMVESRAGAAIATAKTAVAEGDLVTLIGERKSFDSARKVFSTGKVKHQNITIMGDSSTAVWLCRALTGRAFSVRLFVAAHARAEELADKLEHVTVFEADPTDPATIADEHVETADVFIAATNEDERNILACAHAKSMGITQSIAVVQRSKYLHLMPHVGIDQAFCPRAVAVSSLQHLIDTGPIRSLATFADGMAEVYEVRASKRSHVLGHELRNLSMPAQTMIAATRRKEKVYVPGADDHVLEGDVMLVIGPPGVSSVLRKLFVGK